MNTEYKLLLDLAKELDEDGNDTTADAIRNLLNQTVCTVTIKKDGDEFSATDSETNSTGYGKSYPDALIDLAKEMGKFGEGCLQIMEDWAQEELEKAGQQDLIYKAQLKDAINLICTYCEGRDGNREPCDCPVWRILERVNKIK